MPLGTRAFTVAVLLASSALAWLGCSGSGSGLTAPEIGTLEVVTATSGPEPDADGYTVRVDDGAAEPVGANAVLRRAQLTAGTHTVELSGIAANCTVAGEPRRSVTIAPSAVTTTTYAVTCAPTTGVIAVTVASTGPADADGYRLVLDGVDQGAIGTSATRTLEGIPPGQHAVALAGLADGCAVEGGQPRTVSVDAGATTAVSLAVTCTPPGPPVGSLEVVITTSGTPADPDGYLVAVDGGAPAAVGTAASLTIGGLAPGPHGVLLGGLAVNCTVSGDNPRTVTVVAGETATLAFAVACAAVTGSLAIEITGLPAGTDAAVTVTGPGGYSRRVTATRTLRELPPGDYALAAAEVSAGGNRYLPSPSAQTTPVTAGMTANAAVAYAAAAGSLNLRIDGWHLTQGVQTAANDLPLIANREAYLRVFVVANEPNQAAPGVRIRVFRQGTLATTLDVAAPATSTPLARDDDRLQGSWNVKIPRGYIGPGLALEAEVDPDDTIAEQDEDDNAFPRTGPAAPEVRTAPVLGVRFVPVRQRANGLTGDVSADNKARFLELSRKLYPLPGADGDVHAPYTSATSDPLTPNNDNGAWVTILSELDALRVTEGSSRTYYGVVKVGYFSGIAGIGFLGVPTAMGYDDQSDRSRVMAHELGHTWDRNHAPCGAPAGVDPGYPYPGGATGVYGFDLPEERLKPPDLPDIMGYCGDPWISDYTYRNVVSFRGTAPTAIGLEPTPRRSLLVWGRIVNGRPVLEPAFEVLTRPALPARTGAYVIQGLAEDGAPLFTVGFDPVAAADDPGGTRHFAFAVPLDDRMAARLSALRLNGPGGEAAAARIMPPGGAAARTPDSVVVQRAPGGATVRWNAAVHPMAMVRDPDTGEVLSFARGGEVEVATAKGTVEVVLSDRVRSRRLVLPVRP